jgi:hypothetical protein
MTLTRERGHVSAEDDAAPGLLSDSVWSRFAAWAMHAPAERIPLAAALPVWVLALAVHVGTGLAHVTRAAAAVISVAAILAALAAGWAGERKGSREARAASDSERDPHPHVTGIERAIATAAVGAWLTLAVLAGPAGGTHHVLAWAYVAGTASGCWWLRRHPAVLSARYRRDAAANRVAQAAEWRELAALVGLRGSFLHGTPPNNIGITWVINTHGTRQLASQIDCRAVAERLAGELSHRRRYPALTIGLDSGWIPKGRVEVRADDKWADRLTVMIRNGDPWAHPVMYPGLEEDSPYAAFAPVPASIRNPLVIGTEPETGAPFLLVAYDTEDGGKQIAVIGAPGSGKSMLYAGVSAAVTACPDAALLQINIAKPQTDAAWAPAAAATATSDPDSAVAILAFAACVIALRSDPQRGTSHPDSDVHLPAASAPAYVLKIDENGSLADVPGAAVLQRYILQAGRSEAVSTMVAGQRSTAAWFGSSDIRALIRTVIAGNIPAGEVRRMLSEDADVPDMGGYGEGQGGVFLVASRFGGQTARGRTWFMTKNPQTWRKIAQEHAAIRGPFVLDAYLSDLAAGWEALQAGDYREAIAEFCAAVPLVAVMLDGTGYEAAARTAASPGAAPAPDARHAKIDAALASLGDAAERMPAPAPPAPAAAPVGVRREMRDLPTKDLQGQLRALLARPEGVTSRPAAAALGVSHTLVQQQLRKWETEGVARWDGRSNKWREARPAARSVPYLRPVPNAPDDPAGDTRPGTPGDVPGAGQEPVPGAPDAAPAGAPERVPDTAVAAPGRTPGGPAGALGGAPGPAPGDEVLTGAVVPPDQFTPDELALVAASWILLHGREDGPIVARQAGVPEEITARATELLDTDRPYVEAELARWRDAAGGDGR